MFFHDSFTGAADTSLDQHIPDTLGTSWGSRADNWRWQIQASLGQLVPPSDNGEAFAVIGDTPPQANYGAQLTASYQAVASGAGYGVAVRHNGAAYNSEDSYYLLRTNRGGEWYVHRKLPSEGGLGTVLAQGTLSEALGSYDQALDYTLVLIAETVSGGVQLTAKINGTVLYQELDSAPERLLDTGYPALHGRNGGVRISEFVADETLTGGELTPEEPPAGVFVRFQASDGTALVEANGLVVADQNGIQYLVFDDTSLATANIVARGSDAQLSGGVLSLDLSATSLTADQPVTVLLRSPDGVRLGAFDLTTQA